MIAPENKLLFHTAAIVVPSAAVAAAFPRNAPLPLALIAIFTALVVSDVFLGMKKAEKFSAALPDLLRLFRGRPGNLEIFVRNDTEKNEKIRIGIAFPPQILGAEQELAAVLPEGARDSTLSLSVVGKSHGRFFVPAAFIQVPSPFGFWGVGKKCESSCEIRVFPDMTSEKKHLAALFSRRGAGVHPIRQIGRGREFEQLRDYLPGDNYEDIYWKATARRGYPVTRIFQVERTQEIYAVLDSSRFSGRICPNPDKNPDAVETTGSEDFQATILDRFIAAAMVLGLAARSQGDQFGLATFSDQVEDFVRAGSGKAHYNACCDALYTLRPKPKAPDLDEVFTFIATRLRRRSLLIFLTSLDDPVYAESFVRSMEIVRRRHLTVVCMLKPEHARPLFSEKKVARADDLYDELGAHIVWSQLKETEKNLRRKGAGFHLLENERLCSQLVSRYMEIKRKQIL